MKKAAAKEARRTLVSLGLRLGSRSERQYEFRGHARAASPSKLRAPAVEGIGHVRSSALLGIDTSRNRPLVAEGVGRDDCEFTGDQQARHARI